MHTALVFAAVAVTIATGQSLPAYNSRAPNGNHPLWRVPGLDVQYPAVQGVSTLAAVLATRGVDATSQLADFVAVHEPLNQSFEHEAIHGNVGYISFNYTAELHRTVVNLDEFILSLFDELNVTWTCGTTSVASATSASSFLATITFTARDVIAAPYSIDELSAVMSFLIARLALPNASLAWGPGLMALNATTSLWGALCTVAIGEAAATPHFAVLPDSFTVNGFAPADGATYDVNAGITLCVQLIAVSPLSAFRALKHAFVWDPNTTRALDKYPYVGLLFANGTVADRAVLIGGSSGGGEGRRAQQIGAVQTGTGYEQFNSISLASFNWNYDSPGVATTPQLALIPGVPANQVGCDTCYVHMDLSLFASIDFEIQYIVFTSVPFWADFYELGAYVEGSVDVRGKLVLNNPSPDLQWTTQLMPRTHIADVHLSVIGLPMIVFGGYLTINAAVSMAGTVDGAFSYGAQFTDTVDVGMVYNTKQTAPGYSNGLSVINAWPQPTISLPAPDFSGLQKCSSTFTLHIQPILKVSPLNIRSSLTNEPLGVNVQVEATIGASLAYAPQDVCMNGIQAGIQFGVTNTVSVDNITWPDILNLFGLGILDGVLSGTVIQAIPGYAHTLVPWSQLFSSICVPLWSMTPSWTASPSHSQTSAATASLSPAISTSQIPTPQSSPLGTPARSMTCSKSFSSHPTPSRMPSRSRSLHATATRTAARTPTRAPSRKPK